MEYGWISELDRRGVIAVSGPDAAHFLNNLITNDIEKIAEGGAGYGALLTPQGKILFDFVIFRDSGRFLFDIRKDATAAFARRLGIYKLRADVAIVDSTDVLRTVVAWGSGEPPAVNGLVAPDPRLAELGFRAILKRGEPILVPGYRVADEGAYDRLRIRLGVPEGGLDFAFGEGFPHDADMDQLAGVDFKKGCYIGQEVVSRMEHRGTARRRQIIAESSTPLEAGALVTADGRSIGQIGSATDGAAIAVVRLDRASEAVRAGSLIKAGNTPIVLRIPGWARFDWPTEPPRE